MSTLARKILSTVPSSQVSAARPDAHGPAASPLQLASDGLPAGRRGAWPHARTPSPRRLSVRRGGRWYPWAAVLPHHPHALGGIAGATYAGVAYGTVGSGVVVAPHTRTLAPYKYSGPDCAPGACRCRPIGLFPWPALRRKCMGGVCPTPQGIPGRLARAILTPGLLGLARGGCVCTPPQLSARGKGCPRARGWGPVERPAGWSTGPMGARTGCPVRPVISTFYVSPM